MGNGVTYELDNDMGLADRSCDAASNFAKEVAAEDGFCTKAYRPEDIVNAIAGLLKINLRADNFHRGAPTEEWLTIASRHLAVVFLRDAGYIDKLPKCSEPPELTAAYRV